MWWTGLAWDMQPDLHDFRLGQRLQQYVTLHDLTCRISHESVSDLARPDMRSCSA